MSACLLLLFLLCPLPACADDLLSSWHDALAFDAQYASARAARDAGIEKLPQARAGLLPTVSFVASSAENRQSSQLRMQDASQLSTKYNNGGWTVQLTQPVFRWQNWTTYMQGELAAAAAEMHFVQAEQELILRLTRAYFDVLLSQETLSTVQAQKQAITEQLTAAKRSFELGAAAITDAREAQSRYDLAVAQEIEALSDLKVKHRVLRAITGKEAGFLNGLHDHSTLISPQPDDADAWVERAAADNISVQLERNALESAKREVEKQRAGHLPTLDLVVTRSSAGQGRNLTLGSIQPGFDNDSTAVALQLSMPIFSGGAMTSKERESAAMQVKAWSDLDDARQKAMLDAETAFLGVTTGVSQVKAYEAAVISSQASLDSNQKAFRVGLRINIDVLNAQSQFYDTKQKLTKARLDTLFSLLKLKTAVGALGEDDVRAVNSLLE